MAKKTENKQTNKQQINLSNAVSPIDSKNIWILETWLHSETFEEFLQTFWNNKTSTIDILSRVMSKNKVSVYSLWNMKVDINNIKKYDERDWLNKTMQGIISKKFLERLRHTWRLNIPFRAAFEWNFGEIKKLVNKNFVFKDIQTSADEIINDFPEIINNITISNNEIFEWLNKEWFNINPVTNFNNQTPSDKKTLSELVYFETHDAVEKMKKWKSDLEKDMNLLLNQPISPVDSIQKHIDIANKMRKEHNKLSKNKKKSYPKEYQELLKSNEEDNDKKYELEEKFTESDYKNKNILDDIHETNRDIWRNHIKYFETQKWTDKDKHFLDTLSKLVENKFNFDELSNDEQNIFVQNTLAKNINNLTHNKWVEWFWIDKTIYVNFLKQIMWFENKEESIIIPLPNGDDIKFKISKKFKEGEHLNLLDYENFVETKNLPIIYDIEFDEDEETMIDLNKILRKEKNNKDNKIRLEWSDINKINQLYVLFMAQSYTYKNIEETDNSNKVQNINKLLLDNGIEYRGKEDWATDAEELFKNIENDYAYEDDQSEMYEDAIDKYSKLDEWWKSAFKSKLQSLTDNNNIDNIKQTTQEIIDYLDKHWDDTSLKNPWLEIEQIETEHEKFNKEWSTFWWNQFNGDADKWFRKWTRLLINIWWSKLPPEDQTDSFFEIEIINIPDWWSKFQIKIIWNELKSDMEWQTMRFPKTAEHLSKMKGSGQIFKVTAWSPKNWGKSLNNIIDSKIFDKTTIFWSWEWQVELKGEKFVNNEGCEIKSFGRTMDDWDGEKWSQTKIHTTYTIKNINKSKWTIRVLCNFDGQDPDDLSKQINFKYDKELSYEQFILLIESKKTRGYTKEQQKERTESHSMNWPDRLPSKWILKTYSMVAIIGAFKNGIKNIKEKLTKVNEEDVADFENILYSQEWLNLHGRIWNMFKAIWFDWTSEAFLSAKLDHYNKRESMTWWKIEKWYKDYDADPHFPSLYFEQLEPLLKNPWYAGNDKDRHKTAAAFLILMKKDGPYGRWGMTNMWAWFWVEKFLWEKHKDRFVNMFKARKKELEEQKDINDPSWKEKRQDELNRLEFDYMSWIIDGRQPFGGYKDDGEHWWASVRSRDFAKKLDENSQSYFGNYKKRVDDIQWWWFRQSEQESYRMAWAWRLHKAIPPLRRMVETMANNEERNRVKMTILSFMLSGAIKNAQDSSVMNDFSEISRTIWLLPGIWASDIDQQDKVQQLLDWITWWEFSHKTKYKKSDFEPWNYNPAQAKLPFITNAFPSYWTKYGGKILDILEFRDMESENSIINLAAKWGPNTHLYKEIIQFSREATRWNISKGLWYTAPWTANKWIVNWLVPRQWKYKWNEHWEIEMAQEFWKMVNRDFKTGKQSNAWVVEFYLWKFINWFDEDALDQGSKTFISRWLPLIKKLKAQWNNQEAKYNLWYLIKWTMHQKLWAFPSEFGTTIDKFVDFFWNNIDMIDWNMAKNTLLDETKEFDKPYWMLNWKGFWNNYMSIETWSSREKREYIAKHRNNEKDYINREINNIKTQMNRKSLSGWPNPPVDSTVSIDYKTWYDKIVDVTRNNIGNNLAQLA